MTLIESMHEEMTRVRELRNEYVAIGAPGTFGVMSIDMALKRAEKSIEEDNVVDMLRVFEELKKITG